MIPTARKAKRRGTLSRGSTLTGRTAKFGLEKISDDELDAMEAKSRIMKLDLQRSFAFLDETRKNNF